MSEGERKGLEKTANGRLEQSTALDLGYAAVDSSYKVQGGAASLGFAFASDAGHAQTVQ